jgi:hypothetical protein
MGMSYSREHSARFFLLRDSGNPLLGERCAACCLHSRALCAKKPPLVQARVVHRRLIISYMQQPLQRMQWMGRQRTVCARGNDTMVIIQPLHVRPDGSHSFPMKVINGADGRVELFNRQEGSKIGRVRVCQNHDQEAIRNSDHAGWKGVHSEHVNGEGVRDGMPKRLLQAMHDVESAILVCVYAPVYAATGL